MNIWIDSTRKTVKYIVLEQRYIGFEIDRTTFDNHFRLTQIIINKINISRYMSRLIVTQIAS
jgi:hypothetical protein